MLEKYDFARRCCERREITGPIVVSPEEPFFFGRIVAK